MRMKYCCFDIGSERKKYAVIKSIPNECSFEKVSGTEGLTRFQCKAIARAMNRKEERELQEIREKYFRSYEVTLEAFA